MRFLLSLFTTFILALPAQAQSLTDQSIAQWAGSYSELMNWAETNAVDPNVAPGPDMFKRSMEAMQPRPEYAQIEGILSGHGYSDPMAWAGISDRIFEARMAIEADGTGDQLAAAQPQIQQMMEELLQTPGLTDAQKEEILNSLGAMPGQIEALTPQNVDPEDLAAVERNIAVIDSATDGGIR